MTKNLGDEASRVTNDENTPADFPDKSAGVFSSSWSSDADIGQCAKTSSFALHAPTVAGFDAFYFGDRRPEEPAMADLDARSSAAIPCS
ncbi:hypothetical protein [Thioclava nitratireducens]|uniref:hypothetical protein n=1 Tax=Thioclava nitratireducens TaxID=1915078 RepID=UPI0012FE244F|nr:hypothetical protein [Thioclava nitratireducens]